MNEDFYQARILETARAAAGAGRLAAPAGSAEVDNPLCGDRVRVDVDVADGRVTAVAQQVRGCVLCEAAAAIVATRAVGGEAAALAGLEAAVARMLAESGPVPAGWEPLEMFAPVAARPSRHDCVRLPFEALRRALEQAATGTVPG